MKRTRLLWTAGLLVLFALFAAVRQVLRPAPERWLMARATAVANSDPKSGKVIYEWPFNNPWLSDHEFLLTGSSDGVPVLLRRDVLSGKDIELPELSRLAARYHVWRDGVKISPDGRFVILPVGDHVQLVCRADGTRVQTWQRPGHLVWCGDSRHAVDFILNPEPQPNTNGEFYDYRRARIYRVDRKRADRSVRLEPNSLLFSHKIGRDDVDYLTLPSPDRSIVASGVYPPNDSRTVHVEGLPPFTTVANYDVSFARRQEAQILEAGVSPQGTKIAWNVLTTERSAAEHFLHRFLPWIRVHDHLRRALWITGLDGRGRRLLGSIDIAPGSDRYFDQPQEIGWLPGGKKISFAYKRSPYVVPVD